MALIDKEYMAVFDKESGSFDGMYDSFYIHQICGSF